MAFPRNSIRNFLIHAKAALKTAIEKKDKVTLVVGNESADLDSLTASLLYAYVRSTSPPSSAFTPLYIPLTNLPASSLRLRPEFSALLPHANLTPSQLITLDDLPPLSKISEALPPENTRWILVDHNALQGQLGAIYSRQVAGVIDHHAEENAVPQETGGEPRIVTKAGSCTSLVTEYCADAWESLASLAPDALVSSSLGVAGSGPVPGPGAAGVNSTVAQGDTASIPPAEDVSRTRIWDAEVARLALAAVLIDTYNLTDEFKVTQHDTAAATYLEAKIQLAPLLPVSAAAISAGASSFIGESADGAAAAAGGAVFDRTAFFNEINTAKQSIDSLSLAEIFEKDYKQWAVKSTHETTGQQQREIRLGISSVVKPIPYLLEKAQSESNRETDDKASQSAGVEHFLDSIRAFASDPARNLSVYAIMTAYSSPTTGEFERELFVWALDPPTVPAVEKFVHTASGQLRLEDWRNTTETGGQETTSLEEVPSEESEGTQKQTLRKVWFQRDLSKSRKQVAPLLRDALV
ncbi:DHH phosphoesterase [Xylona heveae TC161]|uniref:DHH phosphoesterase n=1 Tax=Xylona heveae (strain CBS 132557 / TC161) TaxID=1328760 RepID=A0A165AE06_XYLHT|nr:DHH phosphoesterase [Xylona heveae TC161]KZF20321.1 DHH phosphoesterase [Xylona heveae TC161]